MNNGFINDLHKDNLYMYGAILNVNVMAVELDIHIESKTVSYKLYCNNKLLRALDKYKRLKDSKNIFSLWRLRRLLRKNGLLDYGAILNSFVRSYCGDQWKAECSILRSSDYKDGFEEQKSLPGDQLTY
jgi:hypothetical protein